jgi:hypothetical protein
MASLQEGDQDGKAKNEHGQNGRQFDDPGSSTHEVAELPVRER